jgi:acetyl esterase/lipase
LCPFSPFALQEAWHFSLGKSCLLSSGIVRAGVDWREAVNIDEMLGGLSMKRLQVLIVFMVVPGSWNFSQPHNAQMAQVLPPHQEFRLWKDDAPGALGKETKDVPTLTPYFAPPAKSTGAAFVICPGGGYAALAPHEGFQYALWLNEQGIAGFVLKYRLGSSGYRHPAMLEDVQRAIRFVRANAEKWDLKPNRVGVMGSSAGGHLAATALTHFDALGPDASDPIDRTSSRPDLGILCYPVITMGANTHSGSRRNLLGDNPDPNLVELLSNEKQVRSDMPPVFIFHTVEDSTVKAENAMEFAAALRRHGVPFELHLYAKGSHGMGLGSAQWDPGSRHPWTYECSRWLKESGFGSGTPGM